MWQNDRCDCRVTCDRLCDPVNGEPVDVYSGGSRRVVLTSCWGREEAWWKRWQTWWCSSSYFRQYSQVSRPPPPAKGGLHHHYSRCYFAIDVCRVCWNGNAGMIMTMPMTTLLYAVSIYASKMIFWFVVALSSHFRNTRPSRPRLIRSHASFSLHEGLFFSVMPNSN